MTHHRDPRRTAGWWSAGAWSVVGLLSLAGWALEREAPGVGTVLWTVAAAVVALTLLRAAWRAALRTTARSPRLR